MYSSSKWINQALGILKLMCRTVMLVNKSLKASNYLNQEWCEEYYKNEITSKYCDENLSEIINPPYNSGLGSHILLQTKEESTRSFIVQIFGDVVIEWKSMAGDGKAGVKHIFEAIHTLRIFKLVDKPPSTQNVGKVDNVLRCNKKIISRFLKCSILVKLSSALQTVGKPASAVRPTTELLDATLQSTKRIQCQTGSWQFRKCVKLQIGRQF